MKQAALEQIAPLLDVLRANPALREVRPTAFHLDGRDFVHFHDEPGGVVADVRLTRGVVRMRVSTDPEQAELLERIDECLSTLDSRVRDRQRRDRHRSGR